MNWPVVVVQRDRNEMSAGGGGGGGGGVEAEKMEELS